MRLNVSGQRTALLADEIANGTLRPTATIDTYVIFEVGDALVAHVAHRAQVARNAVVGDYADYFGAIRRRRCILLLVVFGDG